MRAEHLKLEVFCIGSCSCIHFVLTKVMFSEQGLGVWNKLWILNLANKSVHTLFSFWEICWERGGMKARKEDVELVGKSDIVRSPTKTVTELLLALVPCSAV